MTTPVRTIPSWFPNIDKSEMFTRHVLKASLLRKLAMAQNFLWSRGRVYGGVSWEGQGYASINSAAKGGVTEEALPGGAGRVGLCVATFYVPQSYGPNHTLQVDVTDVVSAHVSGVVVTLSIETLDGKQVSFTTSGTLSGGVIHTIEVEVPSSGEYQCRVLVAQAGLTAGSAGIPSGGLLAGVSHVSARWKPDTTNYNAVWTDYGSNFFSDNYPISSLFLTKLLNNIQTLWATRPPELCQTYLLPPWTGGGTIGTFIEVGRYRVWTPSKVTKYSGKLVVYCTAGGAGNEVQLKLNGAVVQTFTALAAGLNTLTLSAGKTFTDNQFNLFTVEAKSTINNNWGTAVWGVFIWENGCTIPSLPAAYKPLDETALSGDSIATAQDLNSFAQRAGIRQLFNNDRWLAANRFRFLVGDWRHKVFKRGGLRGGAAISPDERTDWTFGYADINYNSLLCPKNITIRADSNSTGAFDTNDAIGDWPQGAGNMGGTYVETPFGFPLTQTYYLQGRRLAHHPVVDGSAGENTSGGTYKTHIEQGGTLRVLARALRRRSAKTTAQTKSTNFVANDDGSSLDGADDTYTGAAFLAIVYPTTTELDVKLTAKTAAEDHKARWLTTAISNHAGATGFLDVKGWTPPIANEGILFETELLSLFIEDVPLTKAQLAAL